MNGYENWTKKTVASKMMMNPVYSCKGVDELGAVKKRRRKVNRK